MTESTQYIASIVLDEKSIQRRAPEIEHERIVAMNDLIEWNHFSVKTPDGGEIQGPYDVAVAATENRVTLTIKSAAVKKPVTVTINLASFRSLIKDYFMICESYFDAIKTGNLQRIEAIDMSRRGLHNEGADMLLNLTQEQIDMEHETARRLFTLICALHLK